MFESVRARLALWHTLVLGVLLTAFALAAYAFLARSTAQRAQEYLASTASAFVLELAAERADAKSDSAAIAAATAEFRVHDLGVAVFDSNSRILAVSSGGVLSGMRSSLAAGTGFRGTAGRGTRARAAVDPAGLRAAVAGVRSDTGAMVTLPDAEGGYRVLIEPAHLAAGRYRVAVVQSLHAEREILEDARLASLIAIPVMLLAAGIGGSFLAKRSLAPVAAMTEHAARISATNLDERLVVVNERDELGKLALVLNDLLSRVGLALEQQQRFMADASHELRTPVSIMRAEAEVALGVDLRPPGSYRESLGVIGETAARLSTVVNELFLLARADAGQQPLRKGPLYLGDLVQDSVRSIRALALRSGVVMRLDSSVEAPFCGDDELLRRMVTNLLDNAVKYSGQGATVFVTLSETPESYRISVRDTGPGVPADAAPHLFERFYRADVARSRADSPDGATGGVVGGSAGGSAWGSAGGGAGLGLAIAQWVAHAHGGYVELANTGAGGSEFIVSLPRTDGTREEMR